MRPCRRGREHDFCKENPLSAVNVTITSIDDLHRKDVTLKIFFADPWVFAVFSVRETLFFKRGFGIVKLSYFLG